MIFDLSSDIWERRIVPVLFSSLATLSRVRSHLIWVCIRREMDGIALSKMVKDRETNDSNLEYVSFIFQLERIAQGLKNNKTTMVSANEKPCKAGHEWDNAVTSFSDEGGGQM